MANECLCNLKIAGLGKEECDSLIDEIQMHGLLNACIPEPDWSKVPNESGELPAAQDKSGVLRWRDGTSDDRWYSWRSFYWGTKWVAMAKEDLRSTEDSIFCGFVSAWRPPINAILFLCRKLPDSVFTLRYKEYGLDYAGVFIAQDRRQEDVRIRASSCWDSQVVDEPELEMNLQESRHEEGEDCEPTDEEVEEWERQQDEAVARKLDQLEAELLRALSENRIESRLAIADLVEEMEDRQE